MRPRFFLALLGSTLLCLGCSTAGSHASVSARPAAASTHTGVTAVMPRQAHNPLLLVSIDGMRNDYTERGLTPTLQYLAEHGTRAGFLRPSYPSITFPNHYTLVTGLRPDKHGVVANFMRDPTIPETRFSMFDRATTGDARWWNDGKPLWTTVSEAGGRSAAMFWVGSEAPVHGRHPEFWYPFDISVDATQRVDNVLAWLDLPADQRPHFITLYFDSVDTAGHRHGPDSAQLDRALVEVDTALGRLLAGLRARRLDDTVNLVIASDHGMLATGDDKVLYLDDHLDASLIDPIWTGAYTAFDALPGGQAQADALLGRHPHFECMTREQIPARFAYGKHRRVPRYHCMAAPGWQLTTRAAFQRKGHALQGEHGYDNQLQAMHSPFIVHGPAFKRGHRIAGIDNVDVYPLLAHLLGVTPEPHDGQLAATLDALITPPEERP